MEEALYYVLTDFGGAYLRLTKEEAENKEKELKSKGKPARILPMNEAAREAEWSEYKELK